MDRYIKYTLACVPIVVGIFYLSGVVFDSAYFAYWGLSSDIYTRSANDTITRGVYAILIIGVNKITVIIIVTAIVWGIGSHILPLFSWLSRLEYLKGDAKIEKKVNGNHSIKEGADQELQIPKSVNIVFGVMKIVATTLCVLTLLMIYLTAFVSREGKHSAEMQYKKLIDKPWNGKSLYDVSLVGDGLESRPRRMITCNTNICLFLTSDGVEVIDKNSIRMLRTFVNENI